MTTIAAVETTYAGHRFRSRLEARWAVFFDTLGVRWHYEGQGYDLDGTWYLPDFWLEDIQCWVEVKGQLSADGWVGLCRTAELLPVKPEGLPVGDEHWRTSGLLLLGEIPTPEHADRAVHPLLGIGTFQMAAFRGSHVLLRIGGIFRAPSSVTDHADLLRSTANMHLRPHSGVRDAYDRARKARFEHGERG